MTKIRQHRIFCDLLLSAASLLACSQTARCDEEAGQLPIDWFILPEDAQSYRDLNTADSTTARGGIFFRRGEDASARALDKIFASSAAALDSSTDFLGGRQPPPNAPEDWVPWHLKEIILDLGASLQGTLGIITARGAVSAQVFWRRVKEQKQKLGLYREDASRAESEPVDLLLTDSTSKAELNERIGPLVNAVMSTGRVTDSEKVRSGLTATAEQLQDLMVGINGENYSSWEISKFRLEVSISGSGVVTPGTTVGAAVRLRFDWARQKAKVDVRREEESESRVKMRRLLTGLASDLDTINRDLYADSGFDLKGFRIGIGMFLRGSIGVARGQLDLFGYAMFSRVAAVPTPPTTVHIIPDDSIRLLSSTVNAQHLSYASEHKVRHERFVDPKTGAEKVVYYMDRPKFREGLNRAAKMGALFASRATKNSGKKWIVEELRPQFALSLMGVAGVVTIGGTMNLEMTFKRPQ